MTNSVKFSRENNFEWLRILFAAQVMIVHVLDHVHQIKVPFLTRLPGVPAFFFVSGFLIYASYRKRLSIKAFFKNRILRLMPALLFVTTISLVFLIWFNGLNHFKDNSSTYIVWFFSQITLGQAYNPQIFRDVGVGVINGSLWTLTAEILFYLSVPLIVLIEKKFVYTIQTLILCSFLIFAFGDQFLDYQVLPNKTFFDFLSITPIVWGWMFLLGSLAYKYFTPLSRYLDKFWLFIFPAMGLIWWNNDNALFKTTGNWLGGMYFICYAALILWSAFGIKYVPLKIDLSYGIYIWHMVIANMCLALAFKSAVLIFAATVMLACISWFVVEKPALKLKKYSLRRAT